MNPSAFGPLRIRLGALLAAGAAALLLPSARAALQWDRQEIRVAAKPGGQSVSAEFNVRNAGAVPVRIKRLEPSCGCTVAAADKLDLAPGERTIIHATVRIYPNESGLLRKSIAVTTSESASIAARLAILIDVPVLVTLRPRTLEWKIGEAPQAKSAILETDRAWGVNLTLLPSDNPALHPLLQPQPDGRYLLSLTPAATNRRVFAIVSVRADIPGAEPRIISLDAAIR